MLLSFLSFYSTIDELAPFIDYKIRHLTYLTFLYINLKTKFIEFKVTKIASLSLVITFHFALLFVLVVQLVILFLDLSEFLHILVEVRMPFQRNQEFCFLCFRTPTLSLKQDSFCLNTGECGILIPMKTL